jgi:putative endonuclease
LIEGYCVYLLQCGDGTLYTGIAKDPARRLATHEAGRGARYTRGRGPFALLAVLPFPDRPSALRAEAAIKRLDRQAKLALASDPQASRILASTARQTMPGSASTSGTSSPEAERSGRPSIEG